MTDKSHPQGITLLLVMLILSIVSSIALGVALLIIRQFEQGADVRDALHAQYIADSGVEEILQQVKFARSGSAQQFVDSVKTQFNCLAGGKILADGEFCTEDEQAQEAEENTVFSLAEGESQTIDLFDPEFDPANPGDEITAIEITGHTEAATWIEVSWVAWNTNGGDFTYIPTATNAYFSSSELEDGDGNPIPRLVYLKKDGFENTVTPRTYNLYDINKEGGRGTCTPTLGTDINTEMNDCYCTTTDTVNYPGCVAVTDLATTPLQYVVRIKALHGAADELQVRALSDCVLGDTCGGSAAAQGIPSRISFKIIGKYHGFEQAVQISVPWRLALAGLYDYVLIAENSLEKTSKVSPGFYNTGTIEAEIGSGTPVSFTESTNIDGLNAAFQCQMSGVRCSPWGVVDTVTFPTQNVRCQQEPDVNASNGATCSFDSSSGTIVYDLENYELGPEFQGNQYRYYINWRAKISAEYDNEALRIFVCDKNEDPGENYENCRHYTGGITEESRGGGYLTPAAYTNRNRDGWLLCSDDEILQNDDYIVFTGFENRPVPRLDWFSVSTIPLTGVVGCEFSDLEFARDSYTFQAEADLQPGESCYDDDTDLNNQDIAGVNSCTKMTNWFSADHTATGGEPDRLALYAVNSKEPTFGCDEDSCTMSDENSTYYNGYGQGETGFSQQPLQYKQKSGTYSNRIAEGDYYVTLNTILRTYEGDTFNFDVGNIKEGGYAPWQYSSSKSEYPYSLPNQDFQEYVAEGNYVSNPDPVGGSARQELCVLPRKMRVKSGFGYSVSVHDDTASNGDPTADFDSFTISHNYPKDASGNNIAICGMNADWPYTEFLNPHDGSYFAPFFGTNPLSPNFIKVNAFSQSYTPITSVRLIASPPGSSSVYEIGTETEGNPYQFEWDNSLPEGAYVLEAIATDVNNLTSNPGTRITVTVDKTDPWGSLSWPPTSLGGGSYRFDITVNDNYALGQVHLYSESAGGTIGWCNGGVGSTSYSCSVTYTGSIDSWFLLTINDMAGHSTTIFKNRDTTPPVIDSFSLVDNGDGTATAKIHATDYSSTTPGLEQIRLHSMAEPEWSTPVGSCDLTETKPPDYECTITFDLNYPFKSNYFQAIAIDKDQNAAVYYYDPDTAAPIINTFEYKSSDTLMACYNFCSITNLSEASHTPTLRITATDIDSGLNFITLDTYRDVGGTREYKNIGSCDFDGQTTIQTCDIIWDTTTTDAFGNKFWPDSTDAYTITAKAIDVRGRQAYQAQGGIDMDNEYPWLN